MKCRMNSRKWCYTIRKHLKYVEFVIVNFFLSNRFTNGRVQLYTGSKSSLIHDNWLLHDLYYVGSFTKFTITLNFPVLRLHTANVGWQPKSQQNTIHYIVFFLSVGLSVRPSICRSMSRNCFHFQHFKFYSITNLRCKNTYCIWY